MTATDAPAETSLHKNPFWILWVSTRDDRNRIVELANEKALTLDSDVCEKARSDLTNPRARLSAEISWFPGVAPNRVWQIANALRGEAPDPIVNAGLPPLARTNVLAAEFEALSADTPATEISGRILTLAKSAEDIDASTVLSHINEDRSVAKFPLVKAEDIVEEELAARRRNYRDVVRDYLNRLPTKVLLNVMNDVVDQATGIGKHAAPLVIEELADSYENEAQEFVQSEAQNLERLVEKAQTVAAQHGESALAPVIDTIREVADNWNKVVRPIQLISKTKGFDHPQSRDLANKIRSLGIQLHNEHNMLSTAQRITGLLKTSFPALPEFSEQVADDIAFIEQELKDQSKTEAEKKQWEKDITYSAEVGVLFKEALKISPNGIQWRNQSIGIEAIKRVSWGGTRHSINGIPTGTTYEILIGDDRREIVIDIRNGEVFSTFVGKLWRAVGIRLIIEHLRRLKGGQKIPFGEATIEDDGVVLQRHHFWSTEPVRLTWHQVQIWSAEGSFVIGAKDDKKAYVALPYTKIPNVHVLEQIIRTFFKTGLSRLSAILD